VPPPAQANASVLLYTQMLSPDTIRLIQQKLHDAGLFGGAVNGDWGNDSEHALVAFQRTHGLDTIGQMNQATAMMLGIDLATLLTGRPGQAAASAPGAPTPAALDATRSASRGAVARLKGRSTA